ncbi:MAG: stage III sporulation protein AE [Corallococcus sp.]|nr:stage III sporulation protein AE [Corallococcus sp.]MCM1359712.1 stage III sporulation protein AE [Corallococcus sp.]MCM1395421.1 stage III sporulation protein AE [Corallococcus sp.]
MKKLLFVLVSALLFSIAFAPQFAYADVLDDLQQGVSDGLDNIDFSGVEEVGGSFIGNFVEKIRQIINGEFDSAESFLQLLGSLFGDNLSGILPQLVSIFCVLVVCGLTRNANDGFISVDTGNVISFVGVTVVLISVLSLVMQSYSQVATLLNQISALTDAAMPILLTLVIAGGGNVASGVCQPAMVMFSSAVIAVVKNLILPLSVFAFVFVVVSNISENVRVNKMSQFLNNASGWLLGVVFMLFSAFTTVQGITAAKIDGVSFRAAKFAAKNYIPILGGYISDGFDIVVAGSSLIKNAFGAVAMLLVFFMAVRPLMSLLCVNLGLQAVAAVSEPLVDGKYVKMLGGISKCLNFLSALVIAVSFMFCILTFIAISCGNSV